MISRNFWAYLSKLLNSLDFDMKCIEQEQMCQIVQGKDSLLDASIAEFVCSWVNILFKIYTGLSNIMIMTWIRYKLKQAIGREDPWL